MNRLSSLTAAVVLAVAAGTSSAATITLGGGSGFAGSFGANTTLAANTQDSVSFSASAANASVSGDVEVVNTGGNSLLLTLTNLTFTSTRNSAVTLTIAISQNYAIGDNTGWTGSHQFNGDVDFTSAGQSASIGSTSTHQSTALPDLLQNVNAAGPGNVLLNRGQGAATIINPVSNPYNITTIYTFVLNRGASGSVVLHLPNSGVDQASRSGVIPLPSASLAGLAGLFGVAGIRRRRAV